MSDAGLSAFIRSAVMTGESDSASPGGLLLDMFLGQRDLEKSLALWFGEGYLQQEGLTVAKIRAHLTAWIACIDELLNDQVNEVLHCDRLQQIEASWRGLKMLVDSKPEPSSVVVRALDVTWAELATDAERAIEFDQTQFFKKVYEEEFGKPGGRPFGLLLGDFYVSHRVTADAPVDDVRLLQSLATTTAAAFAPLVVAADSQFFGADSYDQLDRRLNLERMFAQSEYLTWKSFTESEDSRYVGVVTPRVLMRTPYQTELGRVDEFPFREEVKGSDNHRYLWGNAVYGFGMVAIRAFASSGWLEDIIGASRDNVREGGVLTTLPRQSLTTDTDGLFYKFSTELLVTDEMERDLTAHGLMSLCHCKYTNYAAFQSAPTIHAPIHYSKASATRNEELSSQLHLILCVARFAHYVKVIAREHTGSFRTPQMLETHLHDWIHRYVSADSNIAANARTRFPLREAKIQVHESFEQPGTFVCVAHLRPHVRADRAAAAIRLITELPTSRVGGTVRVAG
ncbi:MAG: type VI secretion system contractile sheath large subunit [Planctomycetaceae bacterium]